MLQKTLISDGYLHDKLLVATPLVRDGCFDKSVIYMVAHNEQGAMGLIVNMPYKSMEVGKLLLELNIPFGSHVPEIPVYFGGPVETNRGYILHSADSGFSEESIMHKSGIALTATSDMLKKIVDGKGPAKYMLAFGCAAWGAGQLEKELESASWLVVPPTDAIVFDTPFDLKWAMSHATLGVDPDRLSTTVGHA